MYLVKKLGGCWLSLKSSLISKKFDSSLGDALKMSNYFPYNLSKHAGGKKYLKVTSSWF